PVSTKPRTFFFAAIAEVLHTQHHQRLLTSLALSCRSFPETWRSVLQHETRNLAALEVPAGGLGLRFFQSGKAGAKERLLALFDFFGERNGFGELALSLFL